MDTSQFAVYVIRLQKEVKYRQAKMSNGTKMAKICVFSKNVSEASNEAKLAKVQVINWIFTQNKFSNLMGSEAKLAKKEAIDWNAYAEQF